jgi:hypothetical protein
MFAAAFFPLSRKLVDLVNTVSEVSPRLPKFPAVSSSHESTLGATRSERKNDVRSSTFSWNCSR